jgi:hypothetical protein
VREAAMFGLFFAACGVDHSDIRLYEDNGWRLM